MGERTSAFDEDLWRAAQDSMKEPDPEAISRLVGQWQQHRDLGRIARGIERLVEILGTPPAPRPSDSILDDLARQAVERMMAADPAMLMRALEQASIALADERSRADELARRLAAYEPPAVPEAGTDG